VGNNLLAEGKAADAIKQYDAALTEYDNVDSTKLLDINKADGSDVNLLLARMVARTALPDWNLAALEALAKDAARVIQLKPGPRMEAYAYWYLAEAKWKSMLSSSPSFTQAKKLELRDSAIEDFRKAIELSPNDPDSYQWRRSAVMLTIVKVPSSTAAPEALKKMATEARTWIDDAIAAVGKRPDLSGQLTGLQRLQQQLDEALTKKGMPRS
jgi:tetratricopeptide (TPR) repeat protein